MYTLIIYVLTTISGVPAWDEENPIIIQRGMTEMNCSAGQETVEDMQLFGMQRDWAEAERSGKTQPIYKFDPKTMGVFCLLEG